MALKIRGYPERGSRFQEAWERATRSPGFDASPGEAAKWHRPSRAAQRREPGPPEMVAMLAMDKQREGGATWGVHE